jgi:hypothetical protein
MEHEGIVAPVDEDEVEHIERADRADAGEQRALAMAVQHLEGEAAAVNLAR